MSELLNYYHTEASALRSPIPWLAELQAQGLENFKTFGFPTSHLEEWKYTKLDSFLKETFSSRNEKASVGLQVPILESAKKNRITWVNGQVTLTAIDNKMIAMPLQQAINDHPDKVKPYLGKVLKQEHGFHALNTAMLDKGVLIYVPAGVKIEDPVLLSHWQETSNQASYIRYLIIADENAEISVIEDYCGSDKASYFTNTVTEIVAAKNAKIKHYKVQRESKNAYHMGHVAINQKMESSVETHTMGTGGKLVRSDITIYLQEPKARCVLNGIYAPSENQHIDHHTVVNHEVPDCRSAQDYKGILAGKSRAVFNGKVIVAKNAQHTEAKQQNKNMLLSKNAEIDTKPQLEIFADDVICTHGATVGQLDEDALFYMATRGISQEEASTFLIEAFASENIAAFGPMLSPWVGNLLHEQLSVK